MVESREVLQCLVRAKVQLGAAEKAQMPYEEDSFVRAGFYFLADSLCAFIEQQREAYGLSLSSTVLQQQLFNSDRTLETDLDEPLPPVLISLQHELWFLEFCVLWRGQCGALFNAGESTRPGVGGLIYQSSVKKSNPSMLISSSGGLQLDIKSLAMAYEGASNFVESQRALDAEY